MTYLATLQKYYDSSTLRDWITRYESSENERQKAQVARWRRVLAELENVEPSPRPQERPKPHQKQSNFDDYTQNA